MSRRIYNRKITAPFTVLLISLLALLTYANIYAFEYIKANFLNSSIFTLKGVSIYGNNKTKPDDIIDASGLDVGNSKISLLIPHIVEGNIRLLSPFMDQVDIERDLYKGWVTINVRERKPEAFVLESTDYFTVVDSSGYILDRNANRDIALSLYGNLPVIISSDLAVRRFEENNIEFSYLVSHSLASALNILRVARELDLNLSEKISEIDATDTDNIMLLLKNKMIVRIADDRLKEGLIDAEYWINRFGSDYSVEKFQYIDARFYDTIYCG